ncbi:MAG: hypothetical protein D6702_06780 [Planctomycetota bacterium]|nr:MAG: hypothetical protein D6702_06780 [Planctomycetota bacterium]
MRKLTASLVLGLLLASCGGDESGAGGAGPAAGTGAGAPGRPEGPISVILVSLDTCRQDRLTPYGAPARNSPVLDALAHESVTFTDCVSQSSNTGPSHRSLFTGQYVHRHRHQPGRYMRSPYSWAGLLAEAGYETAAFTGGGFLAEGLGFEEGFQTYVAKDDNRNKAYRRGFATILPQAERWWRGRDQDKPFFLFLHTYDIHCPYVVPEKYRAEFDEGYDGDLDLTTFCGREEFDRYMKEVRPTLPLERFKADLDHLRNMYDAGIALTDAQLGAFLGLLQQSGALDRSLLIVTSDHGESLGRRRPYLGHNHLWEEQLKVPLLIRFPGAAFAGTVCEEPVMLIDLLPTVLDYLGLPIPEGVQGESLMPILEEGKSYGGERLRISQYQDRLAFRYDTRWKVHVRQLEDGKSNVKLFDLQNDPAEQHSLFADPDRREEAQQVLDRLVPRFQEWMNAQKEADARFAGVVIEDAVSEDVAAELRALGYTEGGDG